MSQSIPLNSPLYPRETEAEFMSLAAGLVEQFRPAMPEDWELLESMANAAWLKQRYTRVRDRLFEQRNSLPEEDSRRQQIQQSIENFSREIHSQREQLANLRRQYRQLARPAALSQEVSSHVLVPAA